MTDSELRALVRDAVARHLGQRAPEPARPHVHSAGVVHPSHVMYLALVNEGDACLIEPTVQCSHCGYCKSHGH